jgi:hypothetical protein
MLRTVVAGILLLTSACGGKVDKPAPTGPANTPVVANGLRGITNDCKTTKTGTAEQLRCTSTKGLIEGSLDSNHFQTLSIGLRSMILPEAKNYFSYALKNLLDAPSLEQLIAKMEKMETGDRVELALGGAKIVLAAGGKSRIAPEYKVELNWQ